MAVLLWLPRFFLQRPFRILWPPACWAVLAFLLYAIVRCRLADIAYAAREDLLNVILYATLFFVIVNNLNRRNSAGVVAVALIALGLGESLFAIYQFVTHSARVWLVWKPAGYALRGSGSYVCPDHFAAFAEMILPLALAYTVIGRLSAALRVLTGYSALVISAGIVVSLSRGALLSTAVAVGLFCLLLALQRNLWRRALVLGAVAVAAAVVITHTDAVQQRFAGGIVNKGDGRLFYWRAAEKIFHQHLWFGAGPEHFQILYPTLAEQWGQVNPHEVHDDYVQTLCEWGVVGLGIVLLAVGLVYGGVINTWPRLQRISGDLGGKNSSRTGFVLGAGVGLFALLVHSFVDFNMHIPANAILAITLMALLTAHIRFGTEGHWVNPGRIGKILL
ncbi:MAG: O-antigen ligase family protein, partial [Bryobacteraceae bacterium]